jgi:hypothetical protein
MVRGTVCSVLVPVLSIKGKGTVLKIQQSRLHSFISGPHSFALPHAGLRGLELEHGRLAVVLVCLFTLRLFGHRLFSESTQSLDCCLNFDCPSIRCFSNCEGPLPRRYPERHLHTLRHNSCLPHYAFELSRCISRQCE